MSAEYQAGVSAGKQAATLESLEERIASLEKTVEKVLERVTLARGGLMVLIAVGSFCTAIVEALVLFAHGGKS